MQEKLFTNYDVIKSLSLKEMALFLAQIEDPNEWTWRCEDYLRWLDEESELDFSDTEKYFKRN